MAVAPPTLEISPTEALAPFVVALDIGSTASRGGLYDATGRPVKGAKQRRAHEFTKAADGTSTIDADQVYEECRSIIEGIVAFAETTGLDTEVRGVALDTFASSLVLTAAKNGKQRALTPCFTYADSRSHTQVEQLRAEVDEQEYHARTGVRLHTSYLPSRISWLRETQPELLEQAEHLMSLGEYVYYRLAGIRGLARSTAAWAGILDAHTGELDQPILEQVQARPGWFADLKDPDEPSRSTKKKVAKNWPCLAAADWFHAIPDGWASNVGPGAVDARTIAVAAATSGAMRVILDEVPTEIPRGLWCYRLSRNSCILGGALNDVGRAVSWLEDTIAPVDNLPEVLLKEPQAGIPVVVPFFTGERATGWAAQATASFTGVTASTGPAHLWRGVVDGLAISYARIWEQLREAGATPERVVATGSVTTEHPEWLQSLANALCTPVIPVEIKRSTLRGTALIALSVLAPEASASTLPLGEAYEELPGVSLYYEKLREKFEEQYNSTI
ncbi:gluconokinase [Corynebacterium sp. A21]|uniref:gluconokinase n=1 Tax=Corynebacterium sp. A21 TaxID=3457318 RepID=UPI003FD003BE